MPPGAEEGLPEWDEAVTGALAGAGIVVAVFDPRGRGESGGEEDYGGPAQQEDLAGVLSWLASRPDVDARRVVLRSRSMGVIMSAGALASYPSLRPAGYVDIEGPSTLPDDLDHSAGRIEPTLFEEAGGDPEWWAARSPVEFLGAWPGHYRRLQARTDHAMDDYMGAAQALLEVASRGAATRVELNGLTPDDAVETESTQTAIWPYPMVQELALEGRVKHDDQRAMDLLLDMYR